MTPRALRALAPLCLGAVFAASAPAAAAAQEPRPLTALDLYHLRTASGVAVSPDGRRVAYVVTRADSAENRYKRDLWIANADGSGARRLTWTESANFGDPAFSPDGRFLAFTSARAGGKAQVWVLPLAEGGEAWALTDLKTGAANPAWSPGGDRIAFTSSLTPEELAGDAGARRDSARVDAAAMRNIHRDRAAALAAIRAKLEENEGPGGPRRVTRRNHLGETALAEERWAQLYVVEARPGAKPLRLTATAFPAGAPSWSPDGRSLAYAATQPPEGRHPDFEDDSDVFVIPAAGGTPRRIAEPRFTATNPRFSADGRWIVYQRQPYDTVFRTAVNSELVAMRADGTERRSVTAALDRGVSSFALTDDGWLYFTVQSEGAVPLYRTRLDRIDPRRVVSGPRGVTSFDVAGGTVAWAQMHPQRPSDVYAARADGSRERRLTALNDSLLARVYVGDYEEIWYPSFDGRRIQGWIVRPLGFREGSRPPLAVEIHGGPHSMWGPGEATMWLEYQTLAGAGYTVFFSNPRGSGGYGAEGLQSIHRNWGTPPARDVLVGADSVLARGLADPQRQAVTGGSYAGYLTSWIIAKEAPERFDAAVAQRGVYDLGIWWGASNTFELFEGEFGVRPWEDPQIVREQSPITYVENVRTPLLMLHGEVDYRTTLAGADAMYRALMALEKPVEMVRYPREGHELTRSGEPAHRVDHMLRILEWFERHVR
ncbi:MAG TPA: S9 family peptidase [Longimicrobiaceae bacterium]|nr:S9 family peptidase [Longimicrobiaceae bacterium]